MTTGARTAMPSAVSRLLWTVPVLWAVSLAFGRPAAADPNPVLGNGVDCMAIVANAQAQASDPSGVSGLDNWGATGGCAATVSQEGWGYDYKHVYLWLAPNGTGGLNLYVCTELFGLPGDADADGGYGSNDSGCDGQFGNVCGGSEGSGGFIIGPSEEITLEIDPNCSENFEPRLRLQLRNDILYVAANSTGSGPAFPTIIGGRGTAWQADPLVQAGPDSAETCADASIRRGAVIFCIENFNAFFAAQETWSPYAFNWKVIGGHSADQLSEDSVAGNFLVLNPNLRIVKSADKTQLCGADATNFTITVSNEGNMPLSGVTVTDNLPAGLFYTGPTGVCEFGAPLQNGNQIAWDLGVLSVGETASCTFGASAEECLGEFMNIAGVSAHVANVCVEDVNLSAADTVYLTCTQPCVMVAAADTQACGVEGVDVPVTLTNCSLTTSNLRLECRLNGQALAPVDFPGVGSNQTRVHTVSVPCASEPSALFCKVVATPVGGPEGCTAADSVTATVTCGEAGVRVALGTAEICVGEAVPLPVKVYNTSASSEDIALRCWVKGALVDDRVLEDVPGGDSTTVFLTVRCEQPETVAVACEAVAHVVGQELCEARWRDESTVVCVAPGVDIEKDTSPRILSGGITSQVTLVVKNTGNSTLDPVRVSDFLPPGVVTAADPQFTATCETDLGGNASQIAFSDFVLGPGEQCVIKYRITCDGTVPEDTLIDRAVVEAWCEGTYDLEPPVTPVTDADTAWVLCGEEMECPEPQNICFWQAQCGDYGEEDHGDHGDHGLLASLGGGSDEDGGDAIVCPALLEHIARCVADQSALTQWTTADGGVISGVELQTIGEDRELVELLCGQLVNDLGAGLRNLGEGQYLTLMMNVCAWALSPSNPVDTRGYVGTVNGVLEGLAGALNSGGDVTYWTEVACSVNNGIGVYVPEECKVPCDDKDQGCTFTQGYWKNHPEAWPAGSLSLGTVNYTKTQLVNILKKSVEGNGLTSLAHQLIAAKLNALAGASVPAGVQAAFDQANQMIGGKVVPPVGWGYLAPGSTSGLTGTLGDYNEGLTGPGHCDSEDDPGDHDSGDYHDGDDHGDHDSGDNHDADSHSSRSNGRRGRSSNGAAVGFTSGDTEEAGDCCTLNLPEGDGDDHHVDQHVYKRSRDRGPRQGGDGDTADHGGSYGCCGSAPEREGEDSAVETASWWWDWRGNDDDHHGDVGDHDPGNDDGEDHEDGGDCEDHAPRRPAFVDKMGLCPPEEEGGENPALLSTQAANASVVPTGEIKTLALAGYPNPVQQSPMTLLMQVPARLGSAGTADLGVYDVTGRLVRRLEVGVSGSGEYRVEWDLTDDSGRGVSSGIYFTKLRVGPEQLTQRILVVRQ